MVWPVWTPSHERICFGTEEGKVKVAPLTSQNKAQILFSHDHPCVSICNSADGNTIFSGHSDFSIYRYIFESEDGSVAAGASRIAQHSCIPYTISAGEHLVVSGQDCIVTFYDRAGHSMQSFDYDQAQDKEHTVVTVNPSGQTVSVAAFNKIRMYDYSLRSRKWEEGAVMNLPNAYSFSSLAWKADGSRLVSGNLTGAVDVFDACLKRYRVRGAFEFTYVSHSQVIVKRLSTGARIVLKSNFGFEIVKVNVHRDRYLVGHTATTILIGDLETCKLSEVSWQLSGRERLIFDNPQVCMVMDNGELSLVEYGKNERLGVCRTDETNVHRLSVRIYEQPEGSTEPPRKSIAYLADRMTIRIDDLLTGVYIEQPHPYKVDWLELNHRATKLLFRDKQHQLHLYNIETKTKSTLLNFCTYVQWVPFSDVVVAQNRSDLCVWYTIDNPDRVTIVPIKGDVEGIERTPGKTEVIVDDGAVTFAYGLDESLIEFGTAMEDRDYDKACDLLVRIPLSAETEAMWQSLSAIALQEMKLYIAERCFAALRDVAKAHALAHINQLAKAAAEASNGATDGYDHYTVRAELYILNKEFHRAEQIYLDNVQPELAIRMWEDMNQFGEAIRVAESRNLPETATKRQTYFSWLRETGQFEKAGEVREQEGKFVEAIDLYLRGGTPARAANVVSQHGIQPDAQLLEAIATSLFKAQIFEKAGDLFEKLNLNDRAIDAYKRGNVFSRAVELAKRSFPPALVSKLQDLWGDYLVAQKQVDQAINHFIEAGQHNKAISAAIESRQWTKAVNILDSQNVSTEITPEAKEYFIRIARHFEQNHQLGDAERYFVKAGAVQEAVEMYSRAGMSDHMHRVARNLDKDVRVALFVAQANQLESKGDYAGAEKIYITINEEEKAIGMYKRARDFTNMIRLVTAYRPDVLTKTHKYLAGMFVKENNFKMAEQHYVSAKEWEEAVVMYRERNEWDNAIRVAKVHGGPASAKQVVLSRAMAVDAEEGVRLLVKHSLVEAGIEAAVDGLRFDTAVQWAQLALPGKLSFIYLKSAMNHEDQGEFKQAEEDFIKAAKPREAIDMYLHQQDFESAMRVADTYDIAAIPLVCTAHARVCFTAHRYSDAEDLLIKAGQPELLVKLYREARMFTEAMRVAKERCPERSGEIAREVAMNTNDPIEAGSLLEQAGDAQGAIEMYLRASRETSNDANKLLETWARAVKLSTTHARHMQRDTLKAATGRMMEMNRHIEAAKCYEDVEDFRGAINCYISGGKFDAAEQLATRLGPDMVQYVKDERVRRLVNNSNSTPEARQELERVDVEAAMKAHINSNDWGQALKLARQRGPDDARVYAAMYCQYIYNSNGDEPVESIIEVVNRDGMESQDLRFSALWVDIAFALINGPLPDKNIDLTTFHTGIIDVIANLEKLGQDPALVQRGQAARDIIHIYHASVKMTDAGLGQFATKLLCSLPRYANWMNADKAFFDAGVAAKDAGDENTAFVFLNRFFDICEHIEADDDDASPYDNKPFQTTDFPTNYRIPREPTVPADKSEPVNTWVLQLTIRSETVDLALPTIPVPGSSNGEVMYVGALQSPSGVTFEPCAITSYPILSSKQAVKCRSCTRPANQEDWNKYCMTIKSCPWCSQPAQPDFKM
eukprot:GILI01004982.1.p1 GENE.GILI01004982.1~~GILI01004982.1.p1  ORF type:complete len:1648 (-),score=437.85 GILI01004982.1:177-5084(-)